MIIPPDVSRKPSLALTDAGKRHDQPAVGVGFAKIQHTFRRQRIKTQRASGQENADSLIIAYPELNRQLLQDQPLLRPVQAAMAGKTQALPGRIRETRIRRSRIAQLSIFSTAIKASLGTCTVPN